MVDQALKVPSGSGKNLAGPCLETMATTTYQQHLHLAYQIHLDRAQLQYNVGLKSANEGDNKLRFSHKLVGPKSEFFRLCLQHPNSDMTLVECLRKKLEIINGFSS